MKKILLFICFFAILKSNLSAQNPAPPAKFEIYSTILNPSNQLSVLDLLAGNTQVQNDSVNYTLKAVIVVLDTTNIANIILNIGDSIGTNNLLQVNIPFNSPNTTLFYKEENIIYIESGILTNLGGIYGQVILEDLNGNFSLPLNFNSNINE
jgi:hypothetical protein